MARDIIIAIDGFSACGKSTLARQLAERLSYLYIDTGSMYRAITLYFVRNEVAVGDLQEVSKALEKIHLTFEREQLSGNFRIKLNGFFVEKEIRGKVVTDNVSAVSAIPAVRAFAVARQREMAKSGGVVLDGRDIGTVVFPHAQLKIFLTADPETRVERRYRELLEKDPAVRKDDIRASLEKRDYLDTHRAVSPLKQAEDAILLDNTHLSREEQLQKVLNWAEERIKGQA